MPTGDSKMDAKCEGQFPVLYLFKSFTGSIQITIIAIIGTTSISNS